MSVISLTPADISSGGTTTVGYRISNPNVSDSNVTVQISADGMRCDPGCNFEQEIPVGPPKDFSTKLTAGTVDPGQTRKITITITATVNNNGSGSASREITVRGPDKPQTVRQVSGRVKDQDGKAVSGAAVGLRDSKGKQYDTTSNGDGGYSFTSSDDEPIAPGALFVGAAKQGYVTASVNAQGRAGKSITVALTLKAEGAASPSASPSPSASVSTEPADEAGEETTEPATDESAGVINAAPKSGDDEGSGSLLFIILGGLLVAAGIGAIVLVLMRRKSGEDPDDQDDLAAAGAVPAAAGRYGGADQTRLAAPMGGRGNDATMIAPRSGAPSMADAPTMIHQAAPPIDEFPDPYGAPNPPAGGYNAPGGWGTAGAASAAGAYGAAQSGPAYGTATQYGGVPAQAEGGYADQDDHGYVGNGYGPAQPAGYADQAGYDHPGYGAQPGYGAPGGYEQPQQRYDEPTGMYRPEPAGYPQEAGYGGYPQADDYADPGHAAPYQAGTYGAPVEPADQAGYGGWGGAGGGMDSGNAYGPPAGGGTYGGAQGGGTYGGAAGTYGAPAGGGGYGTDPADYDPRATYGRPEGYQPPVPGDYGDQSGYAGGPDQTGYYGGQDQQGGRHGGQPRQQPPDGTRPGQRRPNDWIED